MHLSKRTLRASLGIVLTAALIGAFAPPASAAAVSTPDLDAASDTGSSSTDNYTSDSSPTFTVSGVAENDVILLQRDGVPVDAAIAGAGGTVSLTDETPSLPDGVYAYTAARLIDDTPVDASDPLSVTIDTTAPAGTPGTPDLQATSDSFAAANAAGNNTDNITNDRTPTFDISGTVPAGATLQLLRGGATVAASGATAPLTDSEQADGTYSYTARYIDQAGNLSSASAALSVTIDGTVASVTPDLQAASDTGRASDDNITSTLVPDSAPAVYTQALAFTFTREAGAVVTWSRTVNGGASAALGAPAATGSPTSMTGSHVISVLPSIAPVPGLYRYTALQTDIAGNVSTAAPLDVTLDITPPLPAVVDLVAASDTFPAAGAIFGLSDSDNITSATASLSLEVTTEPFARIDMFRDGSQVGVQTDASNLGKATIVDTSGFAGQSSNMHGYVAQVADIAGNRNKAGNLPVYVDTEAPGAANKLDLVPASDTGSDSGDDITNDNTPTFLVTGAEDNALVQLFRCLGAAACSAANRGAPIGSRLGNGQITATDVTPDNVVGGNTSWRFTTLQTDASGRAASVMGVDISIVVDTTDLPTPSVPVLVEQWFEVSPGVPATTAVSPSFDIASGSGRVELLRDGVVVAFRTGAGRIVDPGLLPNGTYEYRTRAVDTAGNDVSSAPMHVVVLNQTGYWLTATDGGVFAFGAAAFHGSTGGMTLNAPILGITPTTSGAGYYLLGRDGGVFAFGDADFFGSTGGMTLNSPIKGMELSPTGDGYWLFADDGGVFTFGDAAFFGSPASAGPKGRVVDMVVTDDGGGYWLVDELGTLYAYGNAPLYDDLSDVRLNSAIVGMAGDAEGEGLWLVGRDGGVFALGDAAYFGGLGGAPLNAPVIGISGLPAGDGYILLGADGGIFTYGSAVFRGSTASMTLNQPIVGMAIF